jgi:hypothetical protein
MKGNGWSTGWILVGTSKGDYDRAYVSIVGCRSANRQLVKLSGDVLEAMAGRGLR